jgi:hypothetical protein
VKKQFRKWIMLLLLHFWSSGDSLVASARFFCSSTETQKRVCLLHGHEQYVAILTSCHPGAGPLYPNWYKDSGFHAICIPVRSWFLQSVKIQNLLGRTAEIYLEVSHWHVRYTKCSTPSISKYFALWFFYTNFNHLSYLK